MNNKVKNVNIWDCAYKDNCAFLNTFEELIEFIENNNLAFSFSLHEKQYPNNPYECQLDKITDINNISITYNNLDHPITILKEYDNKILINPVFFEQNIEKFKEYYKKLMLKELKIDNAVITIPNYLIDDQFIDFIISSEELSNKYIIFSQINNQTFSEEQKNKLKNAFINVTYKGEKISSKTAISYYTIKDLKNNHLFTFNDNLTNEEVERFIHINNGAYIIIAPQYSQYIDERKYIQNLTRIFNILKTHNKNYMIKIKVDNRQILNEANLLNYPNINLTIENDQHHYQQNEYLKEEEQLDNLVKHIKESNLSPYEKYLAVYNIVKRFRPYKENAANKDESRYLRYILDNDFIVCVGFAKLLCTLLDKVGIPNMYISIKIDTSYDNGFTEEEIPVELEGHARNIIKIDDDKYNIHGIYIADPTWDNDVEKDFYQNASITFDRKKEAKRLEKLSNYDLLLDFHNFDDFIKKINYYIIQEVRESPKKESELEKIISAYKTIYIKIMQILLNLDYQKYTELYDKYDSKINEKNNTFSELEKVYIKFLTDYANYIIPLSNQKIDNDTLLDAAVEVKNINNEYAKEDLITLKNLIKERNKEEDNRSFPYSYDPSTTKEHFLETNKPKKR